MAPLVRTEVRLHRRHGLLAAVAVLTVSWVAVLWALPAATRTGLGPWLLFLDLASTGLFFVPALAVVERANGIPQALALTRTTTGAALGVRLGVVAALSVLAATPILAMAGTPAPATALVAVVGTSLLASLLGLVALGRSASLTAWMTRLPLVAVPLLVPALVDGLGLWSSPWLALSPFTGALDLLAGAWSWSTAAWISAGVVGLGAVAVRQSHQAAVPGPSRTDRSRLGRSLPAAQASSDWDRVGVPSRPRRRAGGWRRRAVRSIGRVDRRTILGDGMVLAMLAGLPLMALAVRWLAGPGGTWLAVRHGFDVTPWLGLAATFVVAVHTPVMLGSVVGLLFCEDRDTHVLPAIAVTRAGLSTLVGVRVVATAAVAAVAVCVGYPLAGAHHPLGAPGVVATALVAGAVATIPLLVLADLARDRVQGVALVKVLGLPLYLPVAAAAVEAVVGGPWEWVALVVPTGWAVGVASADDATTLVALAVGGVTTCGVVAWLLAHHLVRTATR